MPATRDVLDPVRALARRELLDAPQEDLALTFDDVASMVFEDLQANGGPASATRETLESISSAIRESLA